MYLYIICNIETDYRLRRHLRHTYVHTYVAEQVVGRHADRPVLTSQHECCQLRKAVLDIKGRFGRSAFSC